MVCSLNKFTWQLNVNFFQILLGMFTFLKRTSFHGVGLNNVANCSDEKKAELHEAIEKGIKSGIVKPFKSLLFPSHQRTEAIL